MELKSILLNDKYYQEFINGNEVECNANHINNKNIHDGEHVMVYKDSIGAAMDVTVPTREMQSEYIGIEAIVTHIYASHDSPGGESETARRVRLRKI